MKKPTAVGMAIFRFFGRRSTTIFRTPSTVTRINSMPEQRRSAMAQPKENAPLFTRPPRIKLLPIAVERASGRFA